MRLQQVGAGGGLLDTLGKERVIASVKAKALLNHCHY